MNKNLLLLLLPFWYVSTFARVYTVTSPNGRIAVTVSDGLLLNVTHADTALFSVEAGMNGQRHHIRSARTTVVTTDTDAPLYRQRHVTLTGRQIELRLDGQWSLQVRAYDEGVAYRFSSAVKGETIVSDETACFCFPGDPMAWLAYTTNKEKPFAMAFQNTYHAAQLSQVQDTPAFLPATLQLGGTKVTILESDLHSYPGMFLKASTKSPSGEGAAEAERFPVKGRSVGWDGQIASTIEGRLVGVFPPYPKSMSYYRWRGMSYVSATEDYIARSSGPRTYPWRVMAITESDTQMPVNNLVYALAEPSRIDDCSWVKPGKVAWDWWNDWNLRGVPFKAGINTDTYLYYIDFAARYGLDYVVLDEGWFDSAKGDIMNAIPDIDLARIVGHAAGKGIGIVLWTVFNVLDEHLDEACRKYSAMGVKGFKVDFLDRNDQTAVEMADRIADRCAKYKLMLDYHGFYTPTGLSRTYPNVVNYEAVFGMEECRWAKKETDMPLYDVTFPFIRMMAGQVDFTPGAMRNGTRENWVECYQNPVSMGTRCHQAACYVVHDSPFTMLCDAPTNYEAEAEYTRFIAGIPVTWDETRILQGQMGHYIVTARRQGSNWYIAGQTNWDRHTVKLPLDFLGGNSRYGSSDSKTASSNSRPATPVSYTATLLCDGINADHNAQDYTIAELGTVTESQTLDINMAGGGGFVLRLRP